MPTWLQLKYALAVEEHRHFGEASKACHVSQPTLSQQLQKLEDQIGIIIFDRTKKPILATPEGERFLEQAKVVMREQEKLLYVVRQSQEGAISGDFRLGIIPTVAGDLLPLFLKPFSKAFPKVNLFIEELKTQVILNELSEDRLDGAILATPIEGTDFKTHPLYYEPFYTYFSPGHRLLERASVDQHDLDPSEIWLLQDGHCFKDQVLNFCGIPHVGDTSLGNVRFQSGSLDTLRKMVQTNRGFTLIPALMAQALKKTERDAHVRPLKPPAPAREISLIYRRSHWKLAIIRALEETIEKNLPDCIQHTPQRGIKVLKLAP